MTPARPSRRTFLKTAGTLLSASTLSKGPFVHATPRVTLRVLGTHVTLQEPLRQLAQQELGIDLQFIAGGTAKVLQQASVDANSFDLCEQSADSVRVLWPAETIQAIDTDRIDHWSGLNSLSKLGRLTPDAKIGKGDAPHKLLFIQDDNELGTRATNRVSFLPYVHNVGSFGYNTNEIPQGIAYETESWGWLLDDRYRGKVALVNNPAIGIFDIAMSASALGLMTFEDIGAMTHTEVDQLFQIIAEKQRVSHFGGYWDSVPESIRYMTSGRIRIQSLFSSAIPTLDQMGIPVRYAAPREGYRAWHSAICLSSKAEGHVKDAAYRYMNWWLSGVPGAFMARQGYYISNPEQSRAYLSSGEWNYWYEGLPADRDLPGTDGKVLVKAGESRSGGSYEKRFGHVAVWNSVMPVYDYTVTKWYEMLTN